MGECSWAQVKEQLVDTDRKSCSGNNFWKCFMDLKKDHLKLFLALSQTSAASSHLFLGAKCCDCSLDSFSEPAFSNLFTHITYSAFLYESFQGGLITWNSPFIRIVGSISSSSDLPFNTIFTCQTYSSFLALTPLGGLKLCMFIYFPYKEGCVGQMTAMIKLKVWFFLYVWVQRCAIAWLKVWDPAVRGSVLTARF